MMDVLLAFFRTIELVIFRTVVLTISFFPRLNPLSHAIINLARSITKSVLILFDVFPDVYSLIHNFLEVIQKGFLGSECTRHIALAILPTVGHLAEACELRIRYAYTLTLSEILSNPTSVNPSDFSKASSFL